jgi:hypothetical protein
MCGRFIKAKINLLKQFCSWGSPIIDMYMKGEVVNVRVLSHPIRHHARGAKKASLSALVCAPISSFVISNGNINETFSITGAKISCFSISLSLSSLGGGIGRARIQISCSLCGVNYLDRCTAQTHKPHSDVICCADEQHQHIYSSQCIQQGCSPIYTE